MLRLSRYHCFLGGLLGARPSRPVTSREIAEELGLSEETVRHDLRNVPIEGRPGSGFALEPLYEALQEFLELSAAHPFVIVGNADILRGLAITFPARDFGMRPVAYFSERAEDVGAEIAGVTVEALADASVRVQELGVSLALIACAPDAVDAALDVLAEAGIRGAVMLTPVLRPRHPEGMSVTYFRIPCTLKSLASSDPVAS